MTQLEQVKKKIEALRGVSAEEIQMAFVSNNVSTCMAASGVAWACEQLLSFIESLEKEPDVDLTKEIARFALNEGVGDNTPTIGETAKHFYELGCRHAAVLYDDMEKERQRRQELEQPQGLDEAPKKKLRKVCNLHEDLKADKPLEERLEELRQIRAEKDRLDEAAEKAGLEYAPKREGEAIDLNGDVYATDDVEWPSRCGFIKGFKAGAEWQAGQGYNREVKVKVDAGGYPYINEIELYDYDKDKPLANAGDKVRVQIRRKK